MSSSISSLFPNAPSTAANASSNAAPAQPAQPTVHPSPDTVKLSEVQQIHQLYNQGQSVTQISRSLSLSVEAVNSYLNISNPSSAG
ncbi:MAG TPA: hypothetical protein VIW68_05010 [Candidatus Sulfotelmatobacter sp.]